MPGFDSLMLRQIEWTDEFYSSVHSFFAGTSPVHPVLWAYGIMLTHCHSPAPPASPVQTRAWKRNRGGRKYWRWWRSRCDPAIPEFWLPESLSPVLSNGRKISPNSLQKAEFSAFWKVGSNPTISANKRHRLRLVPFLRLRWCG